MSYKITIIGLGQIGASIGLALQKHGSKFTRVGHDREPNNSSKAKKMGAVDKVKINLPASVKDADIVLFAIPADQVVETLEFIAPDLKESAVILDTSPAKMGLFPLIQDVLPEGRHFVGFTPLINPLFIHSIEGGVDLADAQMMERALIAICAPRNTASDALKLAADLAELLGAKPLFADPAEIDSYMTQTHLLPQILAAAMTNVTLSQPGWLEGRKFAGRPFALVTSALAYCDQPEGLAASAALNKPHTLRAIDETIAELQDLRAEIEAGDEVSLAARFKQAYQGWAQWWEERGKANWEIDTLANTDMDGAKFNMFGGSLTKVRALPPPTSDK